MARPRRLLALSALLLAPCGGANAGSSVPAVQKVIQMLGSMVQTAKKEKKEEEVDFAKFTTWCGNEAQRLKEEIAKATEEGSELQAHIGKLTSDAKGLSADVAKLRSRVESAEAKWKEVSQQRKKDHEAFLKSSKDFSESVDALDSAIEVLQEQNYDRPASQGNLMQLSSMEDIPVKARSVLMQYAVMQEDTDDDSAPEANAYEFQSGGVMDMLARLRDEFQEKLGDCQKQEMNSKHSHDMVKTDLRDTIENSEREIREKGQEKGRKLEKAALEKKQAQGLADLKKESEASFASVTTECVEKKSSFLEKQQLRQEEIEAMGKAMEIMQSPDVSGAAEKHLSLAQAQRGAPSFVQMEQGDRQARRRVREFLSGEGHRQKSQILMLLAEKLAADPFAKVKQLIMDMLNRLESEANEDATHEGFCDKELGKSSATRSRLSEQIDGLTAAVEEGKATILDLAESTKTLTVEMEELRKAYGEALALRQEEKRKNADTIAEAKVAQRALMRAKGVLKDFYKKALTATALVQGEAPKRDWGIRSSIKMGSDEWNALGTGEDVDTGHKEGMQTFGKSYQGQQSRAENGVLTLIEVIQSDFEGLQADTTAAEAEASKAFESFEAESKKNLKVKERKVEMNGQDKTAAEERFSQNEMELKAVKEQLRAAERYHSNLVPQCMDQGTTYEDRTSAREAEVESLRRALDMLGS